MAMRPLPDQALLLKLLRYDPETGKLYWRERNPKLSISESRCRGWNTRFAGKEVPIQPNTRGYAQISIMGCAHVVHRIVWLMVTGECPDQIDHINRDKSDNRLRNLRSVSASENCRNFPISTRNQTGVLGVCPCSHKKGRWQVRIQAEGKRIYLGRFDDFAEAVRVRKRAEYELGFHPNHGRTPTAV